LKEIVTRIPLVVVGAVVVLAASCSSGTTTQERQTNSEAVSHIETLGVRIKSSECHSAKTAGTFACTLHTPQGVTIAVTINHDRQNKIVYTTTAGLIDGRSTQRRLTQQLELRLRQPLTVTCPAIVAANNHDTFTCQASPTQPPRQPHNIVVTVLDDHTGDFTYRIT
jgi:hypothetical protein